jgi:hypothetical protein
VAIKNGQSRDTCNIGLVKNARENRRGNQEWTIKRHLQHWVVKNARENRRGNQEWTIKRHLQH